MRQKRIFNFNKAILMGMLLLGQQAVANEVHEKTVAIHLLNNEAATKGVAQKIGEITFSDASEGLKIKTNLQGLTPGEHGFHIHVSPSCEGAEKEGKWEAGVTAGGHYDPDHTGHHLGPNGQGHLGDLPVLTVNRQGEAKETLYAKRLKVAQLGGHAVIIHQGGDNYSDEPPMGGGGARIACGVISK